MKLEHAYLVCKCGSRDLRFTWHTELKVNPQERVGDLVMDKIPFDSAEVTCGRCLRHGPMKRQRFVRVKFEYAPSPMVLDAAKLELEAAARSLKARPDEALAGGATNAQQKPATYRSFREFVKKQFGTGRAMG